MGGISALEFHKYVVSCRCSVAVILVRVQHESSINIKNQFETLSFSQEADPVEES